MSESQYETNPFSESSPEIPVSRRQSSYTPFLERKIENENIAHKAMDYIHDENKTQYGQLGTLFGTEKNASKNITFVILFIILLIFCILIFWVDECKTASHVFILNLLDKLLPLFTLAFGYFFGKQ